VVSALLLVLHQGGGMGHDKLESALFWVGAMLAFTPVLVGLGVAAVIWWHRRKAGLSVPTPAAAGTPEKGPEG